MQNLTKLTRTCEPANLRTCEPANLRTCEPANLRTNNTLKALIGILICILFSSSPKMFAQYCGFNETPVALNPKSAQCGTEDIYTTNQRWAPLADDPIKELRLNLIFFQREEDLAGFNINNPKHVKYWNDVLNFMNYKLKTVFLQDSVNYCGTGEGSHDTRIRLVINNMYNVPNTYYWNNENSAANPCSSYSDCPNDDWYAINYHYNFNSLIPPCSRSLNVFFTEQQTVFDKALTGTQNSDFEGCSWDCSHYATSVLYADSIDELRINMKDEYINYLGAQWYGNLPNDSLYWDDENNNNDNNSQVCATEACLNQARLKVQTLNATFDGGNKEQLLQDITLQNNAFQKLKQASPYLSDDVLKETIINSNLLEWQKNDILFSNSPLSNEMMEIAQNTSTAQVYATLYALKYYINNSERDELEAELTEKTIEKEQILKQLLNKYNDEKKYAAINTLLLNEATTLAAQALIGAKLQEGNFSQAENLLTALGNQTQAEKDFKTIQKINIERLSQPNFTLSTQQELDLYTIAEQNNEHAPMAQAILSLLKNAVFDPPTLDINQVSGKTNLPAYQKPQSLLTINELTALRLFPNPANKMAIMYLPLLQSSNTTQVVAYTASGNLHANIAIPNGQYIIPIETLNWKNGVYILQIKLADGTIKQNKLIINH